MMKTEWKLKDDDDEKVHLNIFFFNGEWRTRMGNENMKNGKTTENWEWSYLFSTETRKLKQSFNDNTLYPILFFIFRSFVSLEVKLHSFRGY